MDVSDTTKDLTYAAFVEAAWSRHLGVATLLAGSPHQAEELGFRFGQWGISPGHGAPSRSDNRADAPRLRSDL
ncbi:hypothetical protein GCM10010191_01820 [Actinomadura vinacea]|uniref:GNAT family N-acetyltransferase n=1 Tax=Actinomadura vinacea TaxID=115336 RepID=A0ABN3IAT9_9ACTN